MESCEDGMIMQEVLWQLVIQLKVLDEHQERGQMQSKLLRPRGDADEDAMGMILDYMQKRHFECKGGNITGDVTIT